MPSTESYSTNFSELTRRKFLGNLLVRLGSLALGGKAFGSFTAEKAQPTHSDSHPLSGLWVSSAPAPAPAAPFPAPSLNKVPIVDTHLHLWDLKKVRLPWLRQGDPLCRDHLLEEYLREAEGLNIVHAVYMEVDVHDEDLLKEADYVLDLCQKKGLLVGAVLGGRPGTQQFAPYIRRFKDSPWVKGVRRIPRDGNTTVWQEKQFIQDIRLLGELGMCFDLCMPPQRLPDAIKLVDACPGTRFVLDHCGNADPLAFAASRANRASGPTESAPPPAGIRIPAGSNSLESPKPASGVSDPPDAKATGGSADNAPATRTPSHDPEQWRRDIAELARREHVVCKISGIVARAEKDHWKPEHLAPIVNHCLEVFGPDRVIFASDWPVCTRTATLRQWVMALKEIVRGRSDVDNWKLFYQNAVRFYRLGEKT
ncbi:MAG: amidohydrolase family protein [Thermoguttaceae bacterium]|nr:amidohydrolase family protein [Thermoguttaceae bacterium]